MRNQSAQGASNLGPVNRMAMLTIAAVLLLMGCVERPTTTSQETTGGARANQPKTIRIGTRVPVLQAAWTDERRVRRGKDPLDVDAEVERHIAGLG